MFELQPLSGILDLVLVKRGPVLPFESGQMSDSSSEKWVGILTPVGCGKTVAKKSG